MGGSIVVRRNQEAKGERGRNIESRGRIEARNRKVERKRKRQIKIVRYSKQL